MSTDNPSVIRPFRPADQDGARTVIIDGMREHWGDAFDWLFNTDVDDIAAYYAKSTFLVACDGDTIVATGAVTPQPDGTAIVTRMSTLESHRRRGVARRLLDELIAHGRAAGCTRVVLSTNAAWHDAVAFYTACGFAEMRRTDAAVIFVLPLG